MGKIRKTTETTDLYNKKDYYQYYYLLINNYKLPLNDLLKKISKEVGRDIPLSTLKSFISICEESSIKKGNEMRCALNYSIAMQKGDLDMIRECKEVLDKLEEHKKIKIQARKVNTHEKTHPNDRTHEDLIVDLIKDMNTVIRYKSSVAELKRNGKIINPNLTTEIKNNINEIDIRKYLDFIFVNSDITEMSRNELLQIKNVLEFFIENLRKNYEYFVSLNYQNEEDVKIIKDFNVGSENEISDLVKNTIGRLYTWKLKKIKTQFLAYSNMLKMTDGLLDNNYDSLKSIPSLQIQVLKEDDFKLLYDYYSNYINIKSSYKNNIERIDKLSDKDKEELVKKFNNRLIKK